MSPEQLRGDVTDARSDQFSFCVALWEALTGRTPFPCDAAPAARTVSAKEVALVPRRLRAPLVRGLAWRPEERWPSMTALLDALAREPRVRRGSLRVAAVVTLLSLAPAVRVTVARQPPASALERVEELAELEREHAATLRAIHDYAAAREVAEEAVAIGVFAKTAPARLGDYRFELAQNVWLSGEHARAWAIAVEARDDLRRAGAAGKVTLKALDQWLQAVARARVNQTLN
jgi:hypothetical protein